LNDLANLLHRAIESIGAFVPIRNCQYRLSISPIYRIHVDLPISV